MRDVPASSSRALTTVAAAAAPATIESHWTPEQVQLIRQTVAGGATPDEFKVFLYVCHRSGLDPLLKQAYCIVRGQGERRHATIQVGIDGYRLLATRTRAYAGSDPALFDEGLSEYEHLVSGRGHHPQVATVTVWRLVDGTRWPFTGVTRWDEYCPPPGQDQQWQKMPYQMLSKTAEAQALRKGFPEELSGLYVQEEMQRADAIAGDYRELPVEPTARRVLSQAAPPAPRPDPQPQPQPPRPPRNVGPLIEREEDPRWGYWAVLSGVASSRGLRLPLLGLPVSVAAYQSAKEALIRTLRDQGVAIPAGDPDLIDAETGEILEEGEGQ